MSGQQDNDLENLVVVPSNAGLVRRLSEVDKPRDEIDWIVDDMFGDVDDQGPSATDAVLVTGGVSAIVVSQVVALPGIVLGGGIAAAAIGLILPARSALRKMKQAQRQKKIASIIGDGQLLRVSDPLIADLVNAHTQVLQLTKSHSAAKALRISSVAHGLLDEVVTLLDGRDVSSAEVDYVSARVRSMRELVLVLTSVPQENEPTRSQVAARVQVEADSSSALNEAQELTLDLLNEGELPDDI